MQGILADVTAIQAVQVIMSLDSVNTSLSKNEGLAFAATVYQYITSLIVVCTAFLEPDET